MQAHEGAVSLRCGADRCAAHGGVVHGPVQISRADLVAGQVGASVVRDEPDERERAPHGAAPRLRRVRACFRWTVSVRMPCEFLAAYLWVSEVPSENANPTPHERKKIEKIGGQLNKTNPVPQNDRPGSREPFAAVEPCGPVRLSVGVPSVTQRTRQDGRTLASPPVTKTYPRVHAARAGRHGVARGVHVPRGGVVRPSLRNSPGAPPFDRAGQTVQPPQNT